MSNRWQAIVVACTIAGCSGELIEAPRSQHDRRDAALASAIDRQVRTLPGVIDVRTVLVRPFVDPLAPGPVAMPHASVALHARADHGADLEANVRTLVLANAPDLRPAQVTIVLAADAPASNFASVGPFQVAPSSRRGLVAAFAVALTLILALAAWIGWRERRR